MLEIAETAENFIYDEVFPQLVELLPPDDRLLWYQERFNGLPQVDPKTGQIDPSLTPMTMDDLKQQAPHLWEKYTGDALNIEGRAQRAATPPPSPLTMAGIGMPAPGASPDLMAGQQALAELHKNEFMNERNNFKPQVLEPKIMGLRPGIAAEAGLSNAMVPMGRFG
jgi:hypothetical protein